jgi:hypothetical protein
MDLMSALPHLIPLATEWAETQSRYILQNGVPLNDEELIIARAVGVRHPELIRILSVTAMPKPDHPVLAEAAKQLHFLGPDTSGLTLEYGILIRSDNIGDQELLAHECRHVHQYEQHGSVQSYLEVYIPDLLTYGYAHAPLEIDACEAAAKCILGKYKK